MLIVVGEFVRGARRPDELNPRPRSQGFHSISGPELDPLVSATRMSNELDGR
jgi:hypothetical protein